MNVKHDSVQLYIDSPEKLKKLYQRVIFVASLSQIFGGAGLAAGITVGALLAQQMLGTAAYAGLPIALFTLGSAGTAWLVGKVSQRYGRRPGLTAGFMLGGFGGMGVVLAALLNSVPLLIVSMLIYGAGAATNLQTRYAGTDLARKNQRAKAISIIMVSTTFGAFTGPNMVGVMGEFALSIGIPALAGPFLLSGTAFLLAGAVIYLLLRPDPFLIAKAMEAYKRENSRKETSMDTPQTYNEKGVLAGAAIMVLTQMVMIAIMTMTPVHMGHHGHDLSDIGLVIGIHIGAMYLPSLFTGILVDKFGSTLMSIASGVTLGLASALAAFAPGDSLIFLILALALLGLGWNIGLISGTTKVVDSTDSSNRAKTQGNVDVFIALSGASGGVLSGMVVAGSSYAALSLMGGFLSLMLIPIMLWSRESVRSPNAD